MKTDFFTENAFNVSVHTSLENSKSVFEKLRRFRDGLVWTVDLTVEKKLRFKFLPRTVNGALAILADLTSIRVTITGLESSLHARYKLP